MSASGCGSVSGPGGALAEFETLRYGVHDGVATIELARPDKRNALNALAFNELAESADRAAADPGIRVVLVKGQGPSFCAGIDIALLGQLAGTRGARFRSYVRSVQRPFLTMAQMDKPTVAAVQGHALGAGFQLALACDLRIVADDATFGMLEIRFGLLPDLGGHGRLAALAGPAATKELLWTGRRIDAIEAERLRVANRVVPRDTLEKEAIELAEALAAAPPLPVRATKAIVDRAAAASLPELMDLEAEAQA